MAIDLTKSVGGVWKIIYDPDSANIDLGATDPGGIAFTATPSIIPVLAEETGGCVIKALNQGLTTFEVSATLKEISNFNLWTNAIIAPAWTATTGTTASYGVVFKEGVIGLDVIASHAKKWHLLSRSDTTNDPFKLVVYAALCVAPISFTMSGQAVRRLPFRLFGTRNSSGNFGAYGHTTYLAGAGLD